MKNKKPLLRVKISFYTEIVCEGSDKPAKHVETARAAFNRNRDEIINQLDEPPVVHCSVINGLSELPPGWDGGCQPWTARKVKPKTIEEYPI
jgi:hypothetical protein